MNLNHKLLPRYIQYANQLQLQIQKGELRTGDKLPSQQELASRFGTTLMTIRKALNILEEEGLVRIDHGVGTFVTSPNLEEDRYRLFSLSTEMQSRQLGASTIQIVDSRPQISHGPASRALRLGESSNVCTLDRLRLLHGQPFVFQRSFLPVRFAKLIQSYDPSSSLYERLLEETGQPVTMAKEFLQPINLNDEQAALLRAATGEAAWLSVRVSSIQDGTPVVYDEAILKQDKFVVTLEHLGKRTNCQLRMVEEESSDIFAYLLAD